MMCAVEAEIVVKVPQRLVSKTRRRLAGMIFVAKNSRRKARDEMFFRAGRSWETRMRAIDKALRFVKS